MRRRSGVVHAVAECQECPWTTGYYKNALGNAAQHAQRTGHNVVAEQCISVSYNDPRDASTAAEV